MTPKKQIGDGITITATESLKMTVTASGAVFATDIFLLWKAKCVIARPAINRSA
jgi:hypothetical protein